MVTKRQVAGVAERVRSAIDRIKSSHEDCKVLENIVETDLENAIEDLDYMLQVAD